MLDQPIRRLIDPLLARIGQACAKQNISANSLTITGFAIGMTAMPLLALGQFHLALAAIVINRIIDGIDGAIARATQPTNTTDSGVTDTGGFLDIVLDFIFYASIPLGHVLANPQQNALAGAVILFAFIGTGSSFLAYAIFDAKRSPKAKQHTDEAYKKSFTYLAGLTEGSETIIFLIATCLLPDLFPWLAYGFAVLCTITTTGRILYSVRKLNES